MGEACFSAFINQSASINNKLRVGDLSVFDFFRQETSNPDVVIRTDAMSKMVLVCCLMTPDKVRGDLLPYLLSKRASIFFFHHSDH